MHAIVVNDDLRSKLNGLKETLEVHETDGRVIGRFLPEEEFRRLQYDLAWSACPYSPAELQKLRQGKKGSSLSEFWKKMGAGR